MLLLKFEDCGYVVCFDEGTIAGCLTRARWAGQFLASVRVVVVAGAVGCCCILLEEL